MQKRQAGVPCPSVPKSLLGLRVSLLGVPNGCCSANKGLSQVQPPPCPQLCFTSSLSMEKERRPVFTSTAVAIATSPCLSPSLCQLPDYLSNQEATSHWQGHLVPEPSWKVSPGATCSADGHGQGLDREDTHAPVGVRAGTSHRVGQRASQGWGSRVGTALPGVKEGGRLPTGLTL